MPKRSTFARFLQTIGCLPTLPPDPSFADSLCNQNHDYDEQIAEIFMELNLGSLEFSSYSGTRVPLKKLNPSPIREQEVYKNPNKYIMEQNNILLSARRFIFNADLLALAATLPENPKIIDIGCGNSLTLPGILSYFGERSEYLGVDMNDVSNLQNCWTQFQNVKFWQTDANVVIQDPLRQGYYDLVLLQHPNLSHQTEREGFKKIILNVHKLIKPGGRFYCTIALDKEKELFEKELLPKLDYMREGILKATNCDIKDPQSSGYSEKYIFLSPPKPAPKATTKYQAEIFENEMTF